MAEETRPGTRAARGPGDFVSAISFLGHVPVLGATVTSHGAECLDVPAWASGSGSVS